MALRIAIISLLTTFLTVSTFAAGKVITCMGDAEFGKIKIEELTIKSKMISLRYTVAETAKPVVKTYTITENFLNKQSTDARKPSLFIGATESGKKDDFNDIALPTLGVHLSGLGSEVAFNHESNRVFGTVSCIQK